jgi:BASS family bile acid:Na+ symporter
MEALKQILPLLISGSLAGLVLAIGLDCTLGDLGYLLRRPAKLARAVLAISILTPAAAVILVSILPLQPVTKAGVVLLSISPVPPFVPGRDRSVGGSREYVYGLFAAFALLGIVIVPLSVEILSRIFGVDMFIGPAPIAKLVATTVLLPLVIGLVLRQLAPSLAERAAPIIVKISLAILGVAFIPLLIKVFPVFGVLVGDGTIIASALFALAALAFGHFLGEAEPGNRAALAIAAGTRHPGIAILVAKANSDDKRISAAVLLCFLICFVVTAIYQVATKRRMAAAAAPAGPTASS